MEPSGLGEDLGLLPVSSATLDIRSFNVRGPNSGLILSRADLEYSTDDTQVPPIRHPHPYHELQNPRFILDAISKSMSPRLWKRLPFEITNVLIVQALCHVHGAHLSRLRLVCKTWHGQLWPCLLRHVILHTSHELREFQSVVLPAAFAKPLRSHVRGLKLLHTQFSSTTFSCCLALLRPLLHKLPAVHELWIHSGQDRAHMDIFPLSFRTASRTMLHLRRLTLRDIRFASCSSLLRLIGAFPSLEAVSLHNVRWSGTPMPGRTLPYSANFRNLQRIEAHLCSSPLWPLSWPLAAVATRYHIHTQAVHERQLGGPTEQAGRIMHAIAFLPEKHRDTLWRMYKAPNESTYRWCPCYGSYLFGDSTQPDSMGAFCVEAGTSDDMDLPYYRPLLQAIFAMRRVRNYWNLSRILLVFNSQFSIGHSEWRQLWHSLSQGSLVKVFIAFSRLSGVEQVPDVVVDSVPPTDHAGDCVFTKSTIAVWESGVPTT